MKPLLLFSCATLLSPMAARAAATAIDFGGAITTTSGPGSMAAIGGLTTAFNTVSGFGLNAMAGGNRGVMSFTGLLPANASGLQFTHATPNPNTAGYSIVMDVYYSAIPNFVSLLQLDNLTDGDVFGRGSGALGIDGDYGTGTFTANAWHRLVATVDNSLATGFLNLYVDGALVNSVDAFNSARFDLSDTTFLVFADEDGETADGYISQFQFADRVYSAAEVGSLGAANAAAIPEPSGLLLAAGAALGLLIRRRRA